MGNPIPPGRTARLAGAGVAAALGAAALLGAGRAALIREPIEAGSRQEGS